MSILIAAVNNIIIYRAHRGGGITRLFTNFDINREIFHFLIRNTLFHLPINFYKFDFFSNAENNNLPKITLKRLNLNILHNIRIEIIIVNPRGAQ